MVKNIAFFGGKKKVFVAFNGAKVTTFFTSAVLLFGKPH